MAKENGLIYTCGVIKLKVLDLSEITLCLDDLLGDETVLDKYQIYVYHILK